MPFGNTSSADFAARNIHNALNDMRSDDEYVILLYNKI